MDMLWVGRAFRGSSTGQPEPLQPNLCGICGRALSGKQKEWCSDGCKWKAWDAKHPRLDFTPAASQLAHAVRGRETRAQRILARLRQGPATSQQLLAVGGLKYGARLLELRRAGHRIVTEEHPEYAVYTLEGEP